MKRYALNVPCELGRQRGDEAEMFEIASGAYVLHDDVVTLLEVVEAAREMRRLLSVNRTQDGVTYVACDSIADEALLVVRIPEFDAALSKLNKERTT